MRLMYQIVLTYQLFDIHAMMHTLSTWWDLVSLNLREYRGKMSVSLAPSWKVKRFVYDLRGHEAQINTRFSCFSMLSTYYHTFHNFLTKNRIHYNMQDAIFYISSTIWRRKKLNFYCLQCARAHGGATPLHNSR